MRLAWLMVMKECSTRRSARLRWLGSDDCFCDSRQNSISERVARPDSTTTRPTSVSRLELRPAALALLSEWGIRVFRSRQEGCRSHSRLRSHRKLRISTSYCQAGFSGPVDTTGGSDDKIGCLHPRWP